MNLTETLFKVKLTEDIQFAKCGKKLVKNTAKKKMQSGGDFTNKRSPADSTTSFRKNPTLVKNTVPTADKMPSVIKNTAKYTTQAANSDNYTGAGNYKTDAPNQKDSVWVDANKYRASKAGFNPNKVKNK